MYYPGETGTDVFIIPYKPSTISKVTISYSQNGREIIRKDVASFAADRSGDCECIVHLAQCDTLKLFDNTTMGIQANVLFTDGTRKTSDILYKEIGKQTHREEMNFW